MTNNIILKKLIPPSISPSHNNHYIKLAKSISPLPTSTIPQQILYSTTSINNTLISSSQPDLKKKTSNIIPYIATTYSSIKSKKYKTIKEKVETLKTNLLIPSIPRIAYSTNLTTNDHHCTTSTSQSSSQQLLIPLPDYTTQNSSFPQYSNTDVIHDQKKSSIPILHKISQHM